MAILTDMCSSLEGQGEWQERQSDRQIEKASKTRAHASAIREQRYVSEPIETKYLKFWLLILLGSSGI
jgi:hypothetical protein